MITYLASPYSHSDHMIRETRFQQVCMVAAHLMRTSDKIVFSPIAHTHPIAQYKMPKNWEFWERFDREFLAICGELLVLKLDGWRYSKGVTAEIKIMESLNKPISYMEMI